MLGFPDRKIAFHGGRQPVGTHGFGGFIGPMPENDKIPGSERFAAEDQGFGQGAQQFIDLTAHSPAEAPLARADKFVRVEQAVGRQDMVELRKDPVEFFHVVKGAHGNDGIENPQSAKIESVGIANDAARGSVDLVFIYKFEKSPAFLLGNIKIHDLARIFADYRRFRRHALPVPESQYSAERALPLADLHGEPAQVRIAGYSFLGHGTDDLEIAPVFRTGAGIHHIPGRGRAPQFR